MPALATTDVHGSTLTKSVPGYLSIFLASYSCHMFSRDWQVSPTLICPYMGLQGAGTVLPTLDIDVELTRHDFFYLRRYGMPFAGSMTLKNRFFSLPQAVSFLCS